MASAVPLPDWNDVHFGSTPPLRAFGATNALMTEGFAEIEVPKESAERTTVAKEHPEVQQHLTNRSKYPKPQNEERKEHVKRSAQWIAFDPILEAVQQLTK